MSIKLKNISFCYPGEKRKVLADFSLRLEEGDRLAILGRSGSGKTTLFRIMLGLLDPTGGERISDLGDKRVGAVFQEDRLFPQMTLRENWEIVWDKARGPLPYEPEMLAGALGLEEALDKKAGELSGGMKRRGAIGRALMYDPDYVFLDEPFQGLDPETKERVIRLVDEVCKGKTIFMITHDAGDADALDMKTLVLAG